MRPAAGLMILAFVVLIANNAQAQEASIPLNIDGAATAQLQRTPTLVIHEVVTTPGTFNATPVTPVKSKGSPAVLKSNTSPLVAQPIVFPGGSTSIDGEMGTTGNPKYDELIALSAARNGVDPNLMIAVMRQESGFNSRARSYKGATGLMQLMPGTAQRFGVTNIYDPAQNIEGGARYLRFLLDSFNGEVSLVLAGYNAGEHAVVNSGYKVPRYKETQNYVRSISARYDASKRRTTASARKSGPVAPNAETFAKGRLSNNY